MGTCEIVRVYERISVARALIDSECLSAGHFSLEKPLMVGILNQHPALSMTHSMAFKIKHPKSFQTFNSFNAIKQRYNCFSLKNSYTLVQ